MLAAGDAGYKSFNIAQEGAEEAAIRDDERREPEQRGLAGGGDEMVMNAPDDIVKGHMARLVLSEVLSDMIGHGVDSVYKGRGGRFVSVDSAVDKFT